MGRQVQEDAVLLFDKRKHRLVTVLLTNCQSDIELPSVRQLLELYGLLSVTYQHCSGQWFIDSPFVQGSGELTIHNLDRRVLRGERIIWGE